MRIFPLTPSAAQAAIVSSGTLADLTAPQLALIQEGSIVTTIDGKRWQYDGTGDKTSPSNYILISDETPEWSVIEGKPTEFHPAYHIHYPDEVRVDAVVVGNTSLSGGEPNGIYYRDGSDNGRGIYKSSEGYAIWWDGDQEEWYLGSLNQASIYYVGSGDWSHPWLVQSGDWSVGPQGSGNEPFVTQAFLEDINFQQAKNNVSTRVPKSGNATGTQLVLGNDTRLTNARTPTAHTHAISEINGLQLALGGITTLETALTLKADLVGGLVPTTQLPPLSFQTTRYDGDGTAFTFAPPGTLTNSDSPSALSVTVNGVVQEPGADYTLDIPANRVVLTSPLPLGDKIVITRAILLPSNTTLTAQQIGALTNTSTIDGGSF